MEISNEETRGRVRKIYEQLLQHEEDVLIDFYSLDIDDLLFLAFTSAESLEKQPTVLRIAAPINIVGDLHGQYWDLLQFLKMGGDPKDNKYLFMGDYVDRGKNSIELLVHLLCLQYLYPENVFLIRGNHECREVSSQYGFQKECEDRYTIEVWEEFSNTFDYLPLCAIVQDTIFCVHGGLSPNLESISDIENVTRPVDIPSEGFLANLLWSDPLFGIEGFMKSDRGAGYVFGFDAAEEFLVNNDLELLCRAHQCVPEGYDFPYAGEQNVITVFSASNYGGVYHNKGAMLQVGENKACSCQTLDPIDVDPSSPESPDPLGEHIAPVIIDNKPIEDKQTDETH